MLFNSHLFIFAFLPVALAGFLLLRRRHPQAAIWWLTAASLGFYAYWRPLHLILIVGSIAFNYGISLRLTRTRSRVLLAGGIAANLLAIGYFKYSAFLAGIAVGPDNVPGFLQDIVLPLAISFFTFQQIAYLVDVFRGEVRPGGPGVYALFVCLFPQLIAGPIVRYQQIEPQLRRIDRARRWVPSTLIPGVIMFVMGLGKKVLLADSFAPFADAVFGLHDLGRRVGAVDAWIGTYAYTFQLYFDFSGYSRHGHRARADDGPSTAGELLLAVQGEQRHRVLAPVAYHALQVLPRLCLLPPGRQPRRQFSSHPQSAD